MVSIGTLNRINIPNVAHGIYSRPDFGVTHPLDVPAKIYCDFTDKSQMTFNGSKVISINNQGFDKDSFSQATDARRPTHVEGIGVKFTHASNTF